MAFKPNYNMQRADRERLKEARKAEKLRRQEEEAARRKAAAADGRPEDGSDGGP